jgi:hypothetical protein
VNLPFADCAATIADSVSVQQTAHCPWAFVHAKYVVCAPSTIAKGSFAPAQSRPTSGAEKANRVEFMDVVARHLGVEVCDGVAAYDASTELNLQIRWVPRIPTTRIAHDSFSILYGRHNRLLFPVRH